MEQAQGLEGAVSSFFTTTNTANSTSYAESADIQSDIDDLTTLLNSDGQRGADNVTVLILTGISDFAICLVRWLQRQ